MIRVLIADDQTLVRSGLRSLIEHEPDLVVVAEAANGDDAVHLTLDHRPDIVLMDVRMPGTDGLAATERITSDPELASVKVVVLTTYELDDYIFRAQEPVASSSRPSNQQTYDERSDSSPTARLSSTQQSPNESSLNSPAPLAQPQWPRRHASTCLPSASERYCDSLPTVFPTTRSASTCSYRLTPPKHT
jgi:CheY-like chemotaxis protein